MLHDQGAGLSGFTSLTSTKRRMTSCAWWPSARGDHYQVPNDPDQQASGIRDVEDERDDLVNFSWLHTLDPGVVLTVSPFYHFNRAHYVGGYVGAARCGCRDPGRMTAAPITLAAWFRWPSTMANTMLRAGFQVFGARDNQLFGIVTSDGSNPPLSQREIVWGNVEALFLEDQFKLTSWLTINGGVRLTHFGSTISENASAIRGSVQLIRIPNLNWVLRGFYGRYYQAPPLLTVNGPLLEQAAQQGFGFLPLRGERDEQHEFGLTIPLAGWMFDVSNFRTGAKNFFDHDVLGNSNIFFPLTIDRARIHGWEATANSPRIAGRAQFHAAILTSTRRALAASPEGSPISNLRTKAISFSIMTSAILFPPGVNLSLPWRVWTDFNANYGSGFVDGEGPEHLPSHETFDLSWENRLGKTGTCA